MPKEKGGISAAPFASVTVTDYLQQAARAEPTAFHAHTTPFTAKGSRAKKPATCRGFFQQNQPVTGQLVFFIFVFSF